MNTRYFRICTNGVISILVALFAFIPAKGATPASSQEDTTRAKLSEAVGAVLSEPVIRSIGNIETLGLKLDREAVAKALATRILGGELSMTPQEADRFISEYIESKQVQTSDTLSKQSQQVFMDEMASSPGAVMLPEGVVMFVLTEGEGPMPAESDTVMVRYTGRLADGKIFDSSQPGEEVELPVAGLIKGFTEGLKHTRPGGIYRLIIPASAGYGEKGIPGAIPGNAALDFTVEVLAVRRAPANANTD